MGYKAAKLTMLLILLSSVGIAWLSFGSSPLSSAYTGIRVAYMYHPPVISDQNSSKRLEKEAREWLPVFLANNNLTPLSENSTRSNDNELCFQNRGRLGNKMFQFSAAYSLARYHGRHLVIDSDMDTDLRTLFTMKTPASTVPYIVRACDPRTNVYSNLERGFQNYFLRINDSSSNFRVDGYFESWKYFYHNIADILTLFTLNSKFKQRARAIIERVKHQNSTLIGIQVRRGDIARQQKEAPWSYFQQAMKYYTRKYGQVHFIVASNQLGWARFHFRGVPNVTFLTGSTFEDLATLIECDHSIMSVGTYGWWAGMLARGTVLYYADADRFVHKFFPDADFYPPHWIPMTG